MTEERFASSHSLGEITLDILLVPRIETDARDVSSNSKIVDMT